MWHRLSLLGFLFIASALFTRAEPQLNARQLVGSWQFKDDEVVASYNFADDGTFTAEVQQGETTRTFRGRWEIDGDLLYYTYISDSYAKIPEGMRESDRVVHLDDTSYTIEVRDGKRRTYWRKK